MGFSVLLSISCRGKFSNTVITVVIFMLIHTQPRNHPFVLHHDLHNGFFDTKIYFCIPEVICNLLKKKKRRGNNATDFASLS